jgi:hypothetical protein
MNVELTKREVELLVESLQHCMATCHAKARDKKAACKDCESAKDLNKRLKAALRKEAKA